MLAWTVAGRACRIRGAMLAMLVVLSSSARPTCGQPGSSPAKSADDGQSTLVPAVDTERLRTAVVAALPALQAGMDGTRAARECFTCHNHAVPVFALTEVRRRGIPIDDAALSAQIEHTWEHLNRGRERYAEGKGQGGQVLTAGYALWTLDAAARPSDEVTESVVHYLLQYQQESDHWRHQGNRPPSSGSDFTSTAVALRALRNFATQEQQTAADQRRDAVREWLIYTPPQDTEDHVFRLHALSYADAEPDDVTAAVADLLRLQRADGGWGQLPDAASDAYATGTALDAIQEFGGLAWNHPAVVAGAEFLLSAQKPDGTWHVATRAVPIQTYYESGFPHGPDQFISMSATAWATRVLTRMLPLPEAPACD